MSITLKGRVESDIHSLAEAIARAAQPALVAKANEIGQAGTQEVAAKFAAKYPRARPPQRRRGSSPIASAGNYQFEVSTTGTDVTLEWFIQGDDNFKKKFFSLNNGSRSHAIFKKGLNPYQTLAYNRDDPTSTDYNHFPRVVQHPGTSGSHAYEEALDAVLARYQ